METGSISSNLLPCIQVLSPVRGFVPPWFCRTPEICFSRETLNEFIRFCTTLRKPTKRRIQMIQSLRNCLIWCKNRATLQNLFESLRMYKVVRICEWVKHQSQCWMIYWCAGSERAIREAFKYCLADFFVKGESPPPLRTFFYLKTQEFYPFADDIFGENLMANLGIPFA